MSKGQNALVTPRKNRKSGVEGKQIKKVARGKTRVNGQPAEGKRAGGRRKNEVQMKEVSFEASQRLRERRKKAKRRLKRGKGERVVQRQRGSGGVGGTS